MKQYKIFDGHIDTLTALYDSEHRQVRSFIDSSAVGHVDIPRARKGGMAGGFFAICTPPPQSSQYKDPFFGLDLTANGYTVKYPPPLESEYSENFVNCVIDFAFKLESRSANQFKLVQNYLELVGCIEDEILAGIIHIEGAEPIKTDLSNLPVYYDKGVRSIGLVWSRPNEFGFGVPYRYPSTPDIGSGLTRAGLKLVDACNELKIIIDLAHINDKGFWDVVARSKQPIVVSHTAVHTLCPASRNITDRQIDAIGDSGGVIGIWFEPTHIQYQSSGGGKPISDVTAGQIAKHIEYIAERIGIDHVAIGSDFDGADMPSEISDVSCYPWLMEKLADFGYSTSELGKIAMGNWLRIIRTIWGG
jgi:membrane dipeptidase